MNRDKLEMIVARLALMLLLIPFVGPFAIAAFFMKKGEGERIEAIDTWVM